MMRDDRQPYLAIAVLLLLPVLTITAPLAGAESQSGGAHKGDRPVEAGAEEHSRQPTRTPAPQQANAQHGSRTALEKQVQDVPRIEAPPERTGEDSTQPPRSAQDRPPASGDSKPEESPPQPPPEKPEQEAKSLKPIAPEEAVGILGKKVRGPADEDMGMVVDVLVDGEGKPRAAVIDFGGFLGVGTRKIATDWQLLQFRPADRNEPVHLTLPPEELRAAPEYKPSVHPAEIIAPPPPEATAAPDAEK
jgi:hypothetical protein